MHVYSSSLNKIYDSLPAETTDLADFTEALDLKILNFMIRVFQRYHWHL